jgi:hypothetical protein
MAAFDQTIAGPKGESPSDMGITQGIDKQAAQVLGKDAASTLRVFSSLALIKHQ